MDRHLITTMACSVAVEGSKTTMHAEKTLSHGQSNILYFMFGSHNILITIVVTNKMKSSCPTLTQRECWPKRPYSVGLVCVILPSSCPMQRSNTNVRVFVYVLVSVTQNTCIGSHFPTRDVMFIPFCFIVLCHIILLQLHYLESLLIQYHNQV